TRGLGTPPAAAAHPAHEEPRHPLDPHPRARGLWGRPSTRLLLRHGHPIPELSRGVPAERGRAAAKAVAPPRDDAASVECAAGRPADHRGATRGLDHGRPRPGAALLFLGGRLTVGHGELSPPDLP